MSQLSTSPHPRVQEAQHCLRVRHGLEAIQQCEGIQDSQSVSRKECVGQILESPRREGSLSVDGSRIGWPRGLVCRGLS